MFDHLGEAFVEFALWQTAQRVGIGNHKPWLMKRPDQIFATGGIDTCFSTNRAVHLRNDGGGNLNVGNAPVIDGGRKTCQVPDNSTAEGHEERGAVQTGFDHGIADESNLCEGLRRLAGGNRDAQGLESGL